MKKSIYHIATETVIFFYNSESGIERSVRFSYSFIQPVFIYLFYLFNQYSFIQPVFSYSFIQLSIN